MYGTLQELVAEALAAVGLSGVEDVLPSALSGGMRKRIALARAIVRDDTIKDAEQVAPVCSPATPGPQPDFPSQTLALLPFRSCSKADLAAVLYHLRGGESRPVFESEQMQAAENFVS